MLHLQNQSLESKISVTPVVAMDIGNDLSRCNSWHSYGIHLSQFSKYLYFDAKRLYGSRVIDIGNT